MGVDGNVMVKTDEHSKSSLYYNQKKSSASSPEELQDNWLQQADPPELEESLKKYAAFLGGNVWVEPKANGDPNNAFIYDKNMLCLLTINSDGSVTRESDQAVLKQVKVVADNQFEIIWEKDGTTFMEITQNGGSYELTAKPVKRD